MTLLRGLELTEVIHALRELGGEAEWHSIRELVTKNRGGSFAPYLDWQNYHNTMFQLIQQHCEEYKKYKGPECFKRVRKNRFRLVGSNLGNSTTQAKREEIHIAESLGRDQNTKPVLTPLSLDFSEPPSRIPSKTYRVLRDTVTARKIKEIHQYKCQVCHGDGLQLSYGRLYAEAHHIKPLGSPHEGHDVSENILCVCPNCHVLLDYGAIRLDVLQLRTCSEHKVGSQYVEYHNENIFNKTLDA